MQDAQLSATTAGLWSFAIFAWFALSVAYRWVAGKPILARWSPDDAFVERWASGRSGRGLVARLGTGRNCLQVKVTADQLEVHPHFPFTIGFMPEVYDLDKVIPLSAVRTAVILGGVRAQVVEVLYSDPRGNEAVMQLFLRNAPGFIHAVLARKSAA